MKVGIFFMAEVLSELVEVVELGGGCGLCGLCGLCFFIFVEGTAAGDFGWDRGV